MAHYSKGTEPFLLDESEAYTPTEKRYYSLSYRPKIWVANQEYIKGVDVIVPSVSAGFAHECVSGGLSGNSEPSFSDKERSKASDNTIIWKAIKADFLLRAGDIITDSIWRGLDGENFDNESIVDGIQTRFRLTEVLLGVSAVTMVNHIKVARLNGDLVEFESGIIIPVVNY